jgi:hypothetical protein
MPKPKLPERSTLIAQLDNLFSLHIRLRDKRLRGSCPFHETFERKPIEQCFHFVTRSKHSVRWDERNAVGSCAGCNIRYEHDQTFVDTVFEWYKNEFGQEAWDTLKRDSNKIAKFSRIDLMEIRDRLRDKVGVGA